MYTENNGVKIWYEVHGEGKRTLVMVHGFQIAYSEFFKRAYVPFLSRHMRVVTMDLRGNGKSDRPDLGYDLETYVEDVHAIVEAAHLDRFAIAGHSLGTPVVIKYQATHTAGVSHLILLSGFAKITQSESYPQGVPKEAMEGVLQYWREQPEATLKEYIKGGCPLCQ
jgi:non-heme chloroperoxidase